jgi:hypothetical protein
MPIAITKQAIVPTNTSVRVRFILSFILSDGRDRRIAGDALGHSAARRTRRIGRVRRRGHEVAPFAAPIRGARLVNDYGRAAEPGTLVDFGWLSLPGSALTST